MCFGTQVTKRYKRYMAARTDCDYLQDLTSEARVWMEVFLAEYADASFGDRPLHSPKQINEIYNNQNAARRDVWNQLTRFNKKETSNE